MSGVPERRQLQTGRIRLRPIEPPDYQSLYLLALDPEINIHWRFRGGTPSYDEFLKSLYAGTVCQFIVAARDGNDLLGHVIAYNADQRNRFCYVALLMRSEMLGTGIGIEALILFCNYLFDIWDLRKLYLETAESNLQLFAHALDTGLVHEEGRLRDHIFVSGRYWDQVLLAIWRDDIEKASQGPLGKLMSIGNPEIAVQ